MTGPLMHGIVGFLKILNENEDNFAIKKNNYIEFDTEKLRNFDVYYFNYFYKKYNVAESLENRLASSFDYLKNNIELTSDNKDEERQRKDKIKSNIKYIKESVKKQLDKINKFDSETGGIIKEQYEKLDKIMTKEDVIKIKESIISNLKKESINKRVTLNLFKSILSRTYYGQPSFLNVAKTVLTYDEQQDTMYRDYVSNIVELGFIHDIIEGKYDIQEIKEYISNVISSERITLTIKNEYLKIGKKYINKGASLKDIQEYLNDNVIQKCSMCENAIGPTTNYSEGNFAPLAMSSENAKNFFWNQKVNMPICDICKLILFCIPAGVTQVTKIIKEKGKEKYIEKPIISFVNYDVSVDDLYKINVNFANNSKYENKNRNPYAELILDIVEREEQLSIWQLENIFVVEFDSEYGSYSRVEYFNIKRYMAMFFTKYSSNTLSRIKDYKYKLQIMDCMIKDKDINSVINDRLREKIKNEGLNGYDSFLATQIRVILNLLKKEKNSMENVKKYNEKLYVLYNIGVQIHEDLKRTDSDNKIDSYVYKLLNSVKAGNKKEFMDTIIRIHMAMGKDVSPIFIEAMQSDGLDFESIGHSFLSGLISNKYEKKEEEKNNE